MKVINILYGLMTFVLLCFVSCKTIINNNEKLGLPPSVVIFTFDDGPNQHNETTERLLDVFNKYQIKGVFCLLGVNVLQYPEIVRRIYNEGHLIVNHGFSAKFAYFMNKNEFRENLLLGEKAIIEVLGFELYPKLYRPQGGFYKKWQERIVNEENYNIVPITVRVLDPYIAPSKKDRLTKKIIDVIIKQNGGIIVLHDGRNSYERRKKELNRKPNSSFNRSWIPDIVEKIIIDLFDKGFILNESFEFK